MDDKQIKRLILLIVFIVLLYVAYLILKPFITALLASFFLVYLLYPVYKKINKRIKKDHVSSLITTLLMIALIILPFAIIATIVFNEAVNIYNSGSVEELSNTVSSILKNPQIGEQINENLSSIISSIGKEIGKLLMNIPVMIISFLVMILATFYLFINGPVFLQRVKKVIPFKNRESLIEHIKDTTYSISYGFFVIAFFEFLVAAIGFWIIGIKSPFLWAILVGFSAMLPVIGPFLIVFVPLSIIEVLNHEYYTALGLLALYLIIGYLENISRPKIIGKKSNIHPVIVIIGIIGGITVFGFIGMIAGPIILSVIIIILEKAVSNN